MSRFESAAATGVLCALPGELGGWRERVRSERAVDGFRLLELDSPAGPLFAIVSGPGKVAAAHAAARLLSAGAQRLVCVGTCGAVSRDLKPGQVVHCSRAYQADLAVREGRECDADVDLLGAWQRALPGIQARFLTADRPVISAWRRRRLAGAYGGPCVADMETAALAAVAERAGVPWAAAKIVTDRAGGLALLEFKRNFPTLAGRPADSLEALCADHGG